jgi:hypothetical protein
MAVGAEETCDGFQIGDRVEAQYGNEWYIGILKGLPNADQTGQRRFSVQCDADEEGVLLYSGQVRLIRSISPTHKRPHFRSASLQSRRHQAAMSTPLKVHTLNRW